MANGRTTNWAEVRAWLELVAKALGTVLALAVFWRGVSEYRDAQLWKRTELASRELAQMVTDPLLRLGFQVIDWPQRKVVLPEAYQTLAGADGAFDHREEALNSALSATRGWVDRDFGSLEMVMYVDAIDRVLTFFDEVDYLISVGLIDASDVAPLGYWVRKTRESPTIAKYARDWDYPGLDRLNARFQG